VSVFTDITDFIADHRSHGSMTSRRHPARVEWLSTDIACTCGVTFERWITSWDAELDLLRPARLN
jgi:hypothetical protein